MSTKPGVPPPQQRGPASTIASKSAWANGPPRSLATSMAPSPPVTSAVASSPPTEALLASSPQALSPAPVFQSPQPWVAKNTKDKTSGRTTSVASHTPHTPTHSRRSSSPHSKVKGRRSTSDEPVSPTAINPSIPPTSPTSPRPASSPPALGDLFRWASMITGSKSAPPVPVLTTQSNVTHNDRLAMLSPTKMQEKETAPIPSSSSSSEILEPDVAERELISAVESPPGSNGVTRSATQDLTLTTPSFAVIAGEATTTPSAVPTGSGKLTADARPFIPRRASSTVVIKNRSGEEVDLRKLGAPTNSTATTSRGTTAQIPAPVPKATEEEEEKQMKRLSTIVEVRKRAEEEARRKKEAEEAMEIAKVKAEEEQRARIEEVAKVKAEEEAKMRIQELEAELVLLKAKLAAQSQPLQVQAAAVPPLPLQTAGGSEGHLEHEHVLSSTDDTGSTIYSDNAVRHDEPEAGEEGSQGEKGQEKNHDWSADDPQEAELSYFPITPGPLTAPSGTFSAQQQPQQVPGQPLQKMGRERSRRGGRRERNRTAPVDKGEKGDEVSDPLKLQKSRSHEPRKRPAPGKLDLTTMQRSRTVHPALPTALSGAKNITDITIVVYPAGVRTPKPELNAQSRNGPFRYDREFLMQFMSICTDKPETMADLDEIGMESEEQPQRTSSKRGSRRSRRSANNAPPTPSIFSSAEDALVSPTPGTVTDAQPCLSTSPVIPTVTAITRTSSRGGRSRKSPAAPKLPPIDTLAPPIPITRSVSHGSRAASGPTPVPSPLDRRSKSLKPRKRSESMRQDIPPMPPLRSDILTTAPLSPSHDAVKPFETSANRWVPSSIASRGHHSRRAALPGASVQEVEPPETVERKVKALLNKLSMEKFDTISDQIIAWANKSEAEVDGATLQLVIKLVFEKATDEATWSNMYARLCRKMMEHLSSDVRDENLKDKQGNFVAGGQLFRQYLLSRCQAEFERGWSAREALEEKQEAVVAASGAAPGEVVFSDEYYALQKAKRRGLGLVKFIGELFKLHMLTERIMHRCILQLLEEPAEEDIESVCQLLITVGSALSGPKGKDSMDQYFRKMKEFAADQTVSSRIRYMLQDVIELRARDWIPRNQTAAPTTLAEVHEAAAKEKETASRPIPMARNSSRRGSNRGGDNPLRECPVDGRSAVRSLGRTAAPTLSINSTLPLPKDDKNTSRTPRSASSNVFHSLARNPSDSGSSRTPHVLTRNTSESGSTRHAMARNPSDSGLSRGQHTMNRYPSESGSSRNSHAMTRVPSESGLTRIARNPSEPGKPRTGPRRDVNRRRPSIDFDQLNAVADSGSVGRRKLQLLPRSVGVPVAGPVDSTEDFPLGVTVEEPEPLPSMSESQAKARVEEDVKELFQIRDLTEGITYFESLPGEYRHLLVDKLVSKVDAKEFEVSFIDKLFARVVDAGACNEETFERGFAPTMESLDDISVDVPTAYAVLARLLLAAKLSHGAIGRLADSITYEGDPLVRPSENLWKHYRKLCLEESD